ncbi:nucleoside diphosphate kinase active site [Lucifera butyrica]|uniref:Nucleoside diphosphate kinase n=1 Tax=Lucifera butyrica TaxID=1351585 RepID=A0A498R4C1_9FIRM|nr:nucleoside-diphosphate kinase [Lucifera butyrica]VBB05677.1 nucleoside diphosphate kinase active site [Lucifera butyrica]
MEETLVLVKPDGVARGLTGEIIARFERRGLQIAGLKMLRLSRAQAEKHYEEHTGKPFFAGLVDFITSGPLVAMVVRGESAVKVVRSMMGATNPVEAAPGTIRGEFALAMSRNVIHGSDSVQSAKREISLFFGEHEVLK